MSIIEICPPRPAHHMQARQLKRARRVLKHSLAGRWTRYAHVPTRVTAESKAAKLKRAAAFSQLGVVSTAVRVNERTHRFDLFVRIESP